MYQYWGFGLHIESEIEFPELLPCKFFSPDISFVLGKVPEKAEGSSFSTKNFSYIVSNQELFFSVAGIARYYADNGHEIIIEPCAPVQEMRSVRLHVLATVMAAILLQRNLLPLHASAIRKNNNLFLISGDPGAGKSTLLAELVKTGNTVFSDDIIVLKKDDNNPGIKANASYPMIKLWDDSVEKLNHSLFSEKEFKIRHDLNKYGFFFHDTFDTKSYSIHKIFILKKSETNCFHSRLLKGAEAFDAITKQAYRPFLQHNTALRYLCFTIISQLAKDSTVYEISRPNECKPDELLKYVEPFI